MDNSLTRELNKHPRPISSVPKDNDKKKSHGKGTFGNLGELTITRDCQEYETEFT